MPKTDPSSAKEPRHCTFALASELEEPLNQALAYARALDLMGFGLRNIADDYGPSFLAIAEAMTGQLTTAKNA